LTRVILAELAGLRRTGVWTDNLINDALIAAELIQDHIMAGAGLMLTTT
jgi:hypothetical protein